jgi:hypothetical protein
MTALSPADLEVLEFERLTWGSAGRREAAIREWFNCSPTRHAARLKAVLNNPAAQAYDAPHVRRLLRLRDARRHIRRTR